MYPDSYQAYRLDGLQSQWLRAQRLYEFIGKRDHECRFVRLRECRKRAWFAINRESMTVKVLSNACKLRWCPICQTATRACVASQAATWYKTVKRPKFLTLTVKHSDRSLAEQIDHLYGSWRKLRLSKLLKSKIRGGIWFYQVKLNKHTGQWHPHIHVLLDMNYVYRKAISAKWLQVTGDSEVIDIRAIHDENTAVRYVSRYAGNPVDMIDLEFEQCVEVYDALHGRRLCGTFGTARSVRLRATRPTDGGDWQYLMDWAIFAKCRSGDPLIRVLRIHWQNGLPITDQYALDLIDNWQQFINPRPPPNVVDSHHQAVFSFILNP